MTDIEALQKDHIQTRTHNLILTTHGSLKVILKNHLISSLNKKGDHLIEQATQETINESLAPSLFGQKVLILNLEELTPNKTLATQLKDIQEGIKTLIISPQENPILKEFQSLIPQTSLLTIQETDSIHKQKEAIQAISKHLNPKPEPPTIDQISALIQEIKLPASRRLEAINLATHLADPSGNINPIELRRLLQTSEIQENLIQTIHQLLRESNTQTVAQFHQSIDNLYQTQPHPHACLASPFRAWWLRSFRWSC